MNSKHINNVYDLPITGSTNRSSCSATALGGALLDMTERIMLLNKRMENLKREKATMAAEMEQNAKGVESRIDALFELMYERINDLRGKLDVSEKRNHELVLQNRALKEENRVLSEDCDRLLKRLRRTEEEDDDKNNKRARTDGKQEEVVVKSEKQV